MQLTVSKDRKAINQKQFWLNKAKQGMNMHDYCDKSISDNATKRVE